MSGAVYKPASSGPFYGVHMHFTDVQLLSTVNSVHVHSCFMLLLFGSFCFMCFTLLYCAAMECIVIYFAVLYCSVFLGPVFTVLCCTSDVESCTVMCCTAPVGVMSYPHCSGAGWPP